MSEEFDLYGPNATGPKKPGQPEEKKPRPGGNIGGDQLRAFVERIERLEEEKKAIGNDIKEVYAEAKGSGFDTKVMRQIIRIRKQDKNERAEQEALLDLYMHALGMLME